MSRWIRRSTLIASAFALVASVFAAGPYEGEVRKIDKDAAKITIKHGPLAALDMPPMTMVFQVRNKALLDAVKQGDKVRFDAQRVSGVFVVTAIDALK